MRFRLTNLLVVVILLWGQLLPAASAEENTDTSLALNGESAILIDAKSGQVLYEKNSHAKLYPASITKIATGIYAIEKGNPEDIVTVSKNARYEEGTRVYLGEGEQVKMEKLEYGLLMHSGNDAATAIAEHMSGSTEAFAEELNQFLKETVGVSETHFANAHGLHDPEHYTTASDMSKIAAYAMKNPTFRKIVGTNRLPWDGAEWKSELINHNKLIRDYEGATGIKNGFTDQAMHTLVGSAKRGDNEFIAVTMKTSTSNLAYNDITKMLDYGFEHFETKQIATFGKIYTVTEHTEDGEAKVRYSTLEDVFATVPIGEQPQEQVSTDGVLEITAGPLTLSYPLHRLDPRVVKKETQVQAAGADNSDEQSTASTGWYYGLLFVWLGFNLFMISYTVVRRRRNRRYRSRDLPRKVYE